MGVLALTGVFMMTRIVKQSGSASALAAKHANEEDELGEGEPILTVGAPTVGQAEVSESMLTGREVDADTLRYQTLGEEVSKLVDANPEGAAQLIRRWVEDV